MYTLRTKSVVCFGLYLSLNCSSLSLTQAQPNTQSTEANEEEIQVDINSIARLKTHQRLILVRGMVCGMCVQGIKKLLTGVKGVKAVQIELEAGSVLVDLSTESPPSNQTLSDAVARAGYEVQDIHSASIKPSAQKKAKD